MFLQNKYTKWYYQIVGNAKTRGDAGHGEYHHIIPECFFIARKRKGESGWVEGDPNSSDNIVKLSDREHLICHKLLLRMTIGKARGKMWYALNMMLAKNGNHDRKYSITSREFAKLRENLSDCMIEKWKEESFRSSMSDRRTDWWKSERGNQARIEYTLKYSGENSPNFNKIASEDTRRKQSIAHTGAGMGEDNGFFNRTHSDSFKKYLSSLRKGKTYEEIYGAELAKEIKENMSHDRKGKTPWNKGKSMPEGFGEKIRLLVSGEKNGFYGKHHSEEQRKKKSLEKQSAPKIICPHCNKSVDHMNYSRWHGDKCKFKEN
jgi:hypothetical protein